MQGLFWFEDATHLPDIPSSARQRLFALSSTFYSSSLAIECTLVIFTIIASVMLILKLVFSKNLGVEQKKDTNQKQFEESWIIVDQLVDKFERLASHENSQKPRLEKQKEEEDQNNKESKLVGSSEKIDSSSEKQSRQRNRNMVEKIEAKQSQLLFFLIFLIPAALNVSLLSSNFLIILGLASSLVFYLLFNFFECASAIKCLKLVFSIPPLLSFIPIFLANI